MDGQGTNTFFRQKSKIDQSIGMRRLILTVAEPTYHLVPLR